LESFFQGHFKVIISAAFILGATQITFAGGLPQHPLGDVLGNLLGGLKSMDKLDVSGAPDDMTAQLNGLRNDIESSLIRGLLLPAKIQEERLKSLGVEFAPGGAGSLPYNCNLVYNSHFQAVQNDLYNFKNDKLSHIKAVSEELKTQLLVAYQTRNSEDFRKLLSNDGILTINQATPNCRFEQIDAIADIVDQSQACIDQFPPLFANSGLRPILVNGSLAWSPDLLKAKYQVTSIQSLTIQQKVQALGYLQNMMSLITQGQTQCISPETRKYIMNEYQRLFDEVGAKS